MVNEQTECNRCNESATNFNLAGSRQSQLVKDRAIRFGLGRAHCLRSSSFLTHGQVETIGVCALYLLTQQCLRLYAWRRQVAFLFRVRQQAFGMLLVITGLGETNEARVQGLATSVPLLLFGSLLLIILKQQTTQQFAANPLLSNHSKTGRSWPSFIRGE